MKIESCTASPTTLSWLSALNSTVYRTSGNNPSLWVMENFLAFPGTVNGNLYIESPFIELRLDESFLVESDTVVKMFMWYCFMLSSEVQFFGRYQDNEIEGLRPVCFTRVILKFVTGPGTNGGAGPEMTV